MAKVVDLKDINRLSIIGFHANAVEITLTIDLIGQHADAETGEISDRFPWPAVVITGPAVNVAMAACGTSIVSKVIAGLVTAGALPAPNAAALMDIVNSQPALMAAAYYEGTRDGLYTQL